tara:strand:+ start:2609 stop:4744 length:2136 start_codon:yes stop_codon:yes gene_type:complete
MSCSNRNPYPPCLDGYLEKTNSKGVTCCYKSKPKKPLCNNRNPEPPCKEGQIEKKITKDGKTGKCCYALPNYQKNKEAIQAKLDKKKKKLIQEDIILAQKSIKMALKAQALREKLGKEKSKKIKKEDSLIKKHKEETIKELKKQNKKLKKLKEGDEFINISSTKCNNRNPAPPCKEGLHEKIRTLKNGSKSKCCYKMKKIAKMTKKVSKCNNRNPEPPCKEGYVKETRVKWGVEATCCYKKKTLKNVNDCSNRNPKPPCNDGYVEETRTTKTGKKQRCCYKTKKQVKKMKEPKVKKSLFAEHESLMEFDPIGEVKKPEKQLESRIKRNPNGLLVSEKYDGHRCLYDIHLKEGISRTGKTSFNLPDNWKSALNVSDYHLDGEMFLRGLAASQVSALRTSSPLSKKLWENVAEYHVFDLPEHPGTYTERIEEYQKIVKKICAKWDKENPNKKCPIFAVSHVLMKKPEDIKKKFDEVMAQKFMSPVDLSDEEIDTSKGHPPEGIVLSNPDGKYEFKRSLLKYKFKARYDYDAVVIEPHTLKQSIKAYRADCPPPPDEKSATFYISTEGQPKEHFLPGDVFKYTCLGFGKGDETCPTKPKMPKFLEWRNEEMAKQKKKLKLIPAPKDGPNEEIAVYFDKVSKGYFDLKLNLKAIAYKKYGRITRTTPEKITLENYDQVFGKNTSFGKQAKCLLEGKSFDECVGDRLKKKALTAKI